MRVPVVWGQNRTVWFCRTLFCWGVGKVGKKWNKHKINEINYWLGLKDKDEEKNRGKKNSLFIQMTEVVERNLFDVCVLWKVQESKQSRIADPIQFQPFHQGQRLIGDHQLRVNAASFIFGSDFKLSTCGQVDQQRPTHPLVGQTSANVNQNLIMVS